MSVELLKLEKMGLKATIRTVILRLNNGYIDLVDLTIFPHDGELKSLLQINSIPCPYPGINADNLPYFVPIAACAKGRTLIHDWMYDNRASILHGTDQGWCTNRISRSSQTLCYWSD